MKIDRAASVLLAVCITLAASTIGVAAQEMDGWSRLLTAGPGPVNAIVPGPGWPNDRLILALRGEEMLRSTDAGETWQDVGPWPNATVTFKQFGGTRVAFAYDGATVQRSTDDGMSWQPGLSVQSRLGLDLVFSPRFQDDGQALVRADDRLYLSTDGGATWPRVEPMPGQGVAGAGFWPDAAPGEDVYAIVSSGEHATSGQLYRGGSSGWQKVAPVPGRDVSSVIVGRGGKIVALLAGGADATPPAAVSGDSGNSWNPFADTLAVGDQPYRLSTSALRPTIAENGTIFVAGVGSDRTKPALFRTDDLGATWTHLGTASLVSEDHQSVNRDLVLSPRFGADGMAVLVQNSSAGTPSSGATSVARTGDGGSTWSTVSSEGRSDNAATVELGPSGPVWFWYTTYAGGPASRTISTDGGQTWTSLTNAMSSAETLALSPHFEQDGTLFVGLRNGEIWARGSAVQATDGDVGCASEATGGFGRIWTGEANVRKTLGCPTGPERAVQIRYRPDGERRDLWPEDDGDTWYDLATRDNGTPYLQRRSKQRDGASWQSGQNAVAHGAIQEFAGGVLIFLPESDGRRTIVLLGSGTEVREFPD